MSRRRKTLVAVGLILGATFLVPYIHHCLLRAAANAYIAELKAEGECMDLAEVIPRPTLPEKNGVPLITNALSNICHDYQSVPATNPPSAKRMVAPGKAMVGWQQPEIREISEATNSWEDLGMGLTREKDALLQFQSLFDHPILDFNLDYHHGFVIRDSHLSDLGFTADRLLASAIYNLHKGNPPEAFMNVRTILAIVRGQADERVEISQLVRANNAQRGANATLEILQYPNLADGDLAQLQHDWQSLEFIGPLERALLVERLGRLHAFRKARESSIFESLTSLGANPWNAIQWRWFWSYRDEVRRLRAFQVLIDATRMTETNNSFSSAISFVHTNLAQLGLKISDPESVRIDFDESELAVIFSLGAAASFNTFSRVMNAEIARNMVITAIALERYEIRHHKLPASLDELTPDSVSAVPSDPMDGQLLRYRQNPDGSFLLYSIGQDGNDDGGNPTRRDSDSYYNWLNGRDCVWSSPATEEEIRAYELKASAKRY